MSETEAWRQLDLYAPTEEHAMLARTVDEFVEREVEPQANDFNRAERFNLDLFRKAGELGLLGVTIPERFGGAGLDAVAAVQMLESLSTSDPAFALSVLAHSILFAHNVAINASEEQCQRFLPKAASGEHVGGMCMTEPGAGTDVMGMSTRAERDGKDFVLTGTKTFITNGGVDEATLGDAFLVYATTGQREITAFLVEKGDPGFRMGQKWTDKLGMRASFTAELVFDGVRVPGANVVGEIGQGTLHMMRNLEIERLTLAAMGTGIARRCLRVMVEYANERKAFGRARLRRGAAALLHRRRPAGRRRRDQARREPGGQAGGRCGDPGARRQRLHGRVRGRAAVARREAARDRRRHARGPPQEHDEGSLARSFDPRLKRSLAGGGLVARATRAAVRRRPCRSASRRAAASPPRRAGAGRRCAP